MKNAYLVIILLSLFMNDSFADTANLGQKADDMLLSSISSMVGVKKLFDRSALHVALSEQYPRGMKYETIFASLASRLVNLSRDSEIQYILAFEKKAIAFSVVLRIKDQQKKLVIVWRFDEMNALSRVDDSLLLSPIDAPKPGALIMPDN